jgi:hypothetical protein
MVVLLAVIVAVRWEVHSVYYWEPRWGWTMVLRWADEWDPRLVIEKGD